RCDRRILIELDGGWRGERISAALPANIWPEPEHELLDGILMHRPGRRRHQQLAVDDFVARPMRRILGVELAGLGSGPHHFVTVCARVAPPAGNWLPISLPRT